MKTAKLLKAHAELTAAIRASEPWEKSYTDDSANFKRLLKAEAGMQASVNGYLLGLKDRVEQLVNWSDTTITAAALSPLNSDEWKEEARLFYAAAADYILDLYVIGANAGELRYSRPIGITTLDEAIQYAAERHAATLVSQVTKTTRSQIQRAIKQSIKRGETLSESVWRIRKLVASPVRAEMIAQTESVNAYQGGLDIFGDKTGVVSWEWEALIGACELCAPLNGVTMKAGESFTLGNGSQVSRPPGHPRCRCGRIANYDNKH